MTASAAQPLSPVPSLLPDPVITRVRPASRTRVWGAGAVAGGAVVVFGAMAPWIVFGFDGTRTTVSPTVGGMSGAVGLIATAVVAASAGLAWVVGGSVTWVHRTVLIAAGLVTLAQVARMLPGVFDTVNQVRGPAVAVVGLGPYVALLGAVVILRCALSGARFDTLGHKKAILRATVVMAATAVAVAVLPPEPIVGGVRNGVPVEPIYVASGLTLPAGMSRVDVADRACRELPEGGTDGAAQTIRAVADTSPSQALKFMTVLQRSGYC